LLTRARELTPGDDPLADELELELRELGDLDALEALLRERIARCREAAGSGLDRSSLDPALREAWIARIEALVELLERERELDQDLDPDLAREGGHEQSSP